MPCPLFVVVPGAWDTPATMEPLLEPLESAGHAVIVVDLPCDDADATLEEYADAVRAVLPDDLADVVLVGYSFGGFTASRIAVEHPDVPVVYVAAWIPRDGVSVLDLFAGGDPFEAGEEAGIAAFDGADPQCRPRSVRPEHRSLRRRGRSVRAGRDPRPTSSGRNVRRASPRCARSGGAICRLPAAAPTS